MKKLMSYLRGSKFEQSVIDLRNMLEAEHDYMKALQ
jgi:hypothetical protein